MFLAFPCIFWASILLQLIGGDYTITIHPEFLAQGGNTQFETDRWNGHGSLDWPNNVEMNMAIGTKSARWVNTDFRNDAYKKAPEDPHRKGYPDPKYFSNHQFEEKLASLFLENLKSYGFDHDIVMGQRGTSWPHWMNTSNHAHMFPNNMDAGTEMALLLLKAVSRYTGGHVPSYFEVINEPDNLFLSGHVSWETIINYYHKMAEKVKKTFPKMKVGGPTHTSAVAVADRFDFRIWKRMKQFLDMSLDHLDFYGFHSYNYIDTAGYTNEWRSMSEGRLVNVIDMIESYSWQKKGRGFPIVITEYGMGGQNMNSTTATNFQEWGHCFMRNGQLFTFLNFRADIDRAIPFLLNIVEKFAAASIYRDHQYTHIAKTYEFWHHFSDSFQFLRVDSEFNGQERHISSLAMANPKTKEVVILLHNFQNKEVRVKMNFLNHWTNVNNIHKTCFYKGANDVPVLDKNQAVKLTANVFNMPAQTSCFLSKMSEHSFGSVPTVQQQTYYSHKMVVPIEKKMVNAVVSVPSLGNVRFANLRIGVSYEDNKAHTKPLAVHINGHEITALYYLYQPGRGRGDSVWDVYVYQVPASSLKQHNNAIQLEFVQDGGHVTTVALVVGKETGGSTIIG